jgi:AraC-like DNA-binding protein
MTIRSISAFLPVEYQDLIFEKIYQSLYRPGMGPLKLIQEFGLDKLGLVKGKWNIWRHGDISLGIRDLHVLKSFAVPAPVSNLLSLECILKGETEIIVGGHEIPMSGMPCVYLASHTENSQITRIFRAGDRVSSVGLGIPPALLMDQFDLAPEDCPPSIRKIINLTGRYTVTLPLTSMLQKLVREAIDMQFEGMRAERFMEAKILELLCHLCEVVTAPEERFLGDNPLPRRKEQAMRQVIGILRNNIAAPPGQEELASQVGLSRTTLANTFRNSFGVTINHYLHQQRMELAHHLIQDGKQSIMEVAQTVGYGDQSAFGRAYKRYFDNSPKADRSS